VKGSCHVPSAKRHGHQARYQHIDTNNNLRKWK
jgi:hypothetical protein